MEWYIPAALLPSELQQSLNVITQFLETPLDLDGKKASSLLSKQRRKRRRLRASSPESDAEDSDAPRRKKEKKKKEAKQYKSAAFIDDSDAEYGDMEAFLEKEKALREKTARLAAESGRVATMRARGTKKRRRKADNDEVGKNTKKRRNATASEGSEGEQSERSQNDLNDEFDVFGSPKHPVSTADTTPDPSHVESPKSRPRPRPAFKGRRSSPDVTPRESASPIASAGTSPSSNAPLDTHKSVLPSPAGYSSDEAASELNAARIGGHRKKGRMNLVVSDDED